MGNIIKQEAIQAYHTIFEHKIDMVLKIITFI